MIGNSGKLILTHSLPTPDTVKHWTIKVRVFLKRKKFVIASHYVFEVHVISGV